VLQELVAHKESQAKEWILLVDHVQMMPSIPPKFTVSQNMGYAKGNSLMHLPGYMVEEDLRG
jgi:putative transposase